MRPWQLYGRWLAWAGRSAEAAAAYEKAAERRPGHLAPLLALPRLLREAGRATDAARWAERRDPVVAHLDPWTVLEAAWRELPAPRTDEVLLARDDYGAVRNFLHGGGNHRWTRSRAWIRLVPPRPAAAYIVTIDMGAPPPAPRPHANVRVRVDGGAEAAFTLDGEVRPYTLRTPKPAGAELLIELRSPTWNRSDLPPDHGVRVDRMTVAPAPE
jgi:hypothetical protein